MRGYSNYQRRHTNPLTHSKVKRLNLLQIAIAVESANKRMALLQNTIFPYMKQGPYITAKNTLIN